MTFTLRQMVVRKKAEQLAFNVFLKIYSSDYWCRGSQKERGDFPGGIADKNFPANRGNLGSIFMWEDLTNHRASEALAATTTEPEL